MIAQEHSLSLSLSFIGVVYVALEELQEVFLRKAELLSRILKLRIIFLPDFCLYDFPQRPKREIFYEFSEDQTKP